jgi:hypothetical protein
MDTMQRHILHEDIGKIVRNVLPNGAIHVDTDAFFYKLQRLNQ